MSQNEKGSGWIRMYRDARDSWLWDDPEKWRAWCDILFRCNYKSNDIMIGGKIMTMAPGTLHTSIEKLAVSWSWDRKTVRRFLKNLEEHGDITTERTPHGTSITVVKWGFYQSDESLEGQPEGQPEGQLKGQPEGQLKGHREERKKERSVKKKEVCVSDGTGADAPHTHNSEIDELWKKTYSLYPKKGNAKSASLLFYQHIKNAPDKKEAAKKLCDGIIAYMQDYRRTNPDDTEYRYVVNFDKWLQEDADYWMEAVNR